MAVANIYVLRVSTSCLLPLWETLQDQQVILTQDLFKLLLLTWVPECVRFCVCPLRVESLFPTTLWLFEALLAFKDKCFGGSSSEHRTPRLGSLMWGSGLSHSCEITSVV